MTQAAEVLTIAPGPAFADDLLEALRAQAAPGTGPRTLRHAAAVAAVAAGGATFYGVMWLRRRGAVR